jgi:hypothetical protein
LDTKGAVAVFILTGAVVVGTYRFRGIDLGKGFDRKD